MLKLSKKWKPWLNNHYRFKVAFGGRAGGKSWTIATILLIIASQKKLRIACLREYQKSLADSAYKLLCDLIRADDALSSFYRIYFDRIEGANGSEFKFSGIKNANNFKSFEGADIAWVEEAQAVSHKSMQILIPTIRKDKSEIWFSYNPDAEDDAVHQLMLKPRQSQFNLNINYTDNPFISDIMIEEANHLKTIDFDLYKHIWLGEIAQHAERQILKNIEISEVVDNYVVNSMDHCIIDGTHIIDWRYGIDFGFTDPTAIVESYMYKGDIYIHNEICETELQTSQIRDRIESNMQRALKHKIYADSHRPDTIAELNSLGLNTIGAYKGGGSVADGLQWLRSRKIYIHPRCTNTIKAIKNYLWKVNSRTGQILDIPSHDYSHIPDALRYGYNDLIFDKSSSWIYDDDVYDAMINPHRY